MTVKIGINGFGRIGRLTYRVMHKMDDVEVVAINDLTDSFTLAHLLTYDSTYGKFNAEVKSDKESISIDGKRVQIYAQAEPGKIPWNEHDVDIIIEATGHFRTRDTARLHLGGSVKKVIVTTPVNDGDIMVVMGINEEKYNDKEHNILSNASCTTNALAPVVKVLHQEFGIEKGLMNTVHSYTNDQRLLDLPHPDLRRARAANLSVIPTSTGAARAIGMVMPELEGKIDGFALRVPTPTVSVIDFVANLKEKVTSESVNKAFKNYAEEKMTGILGYSTTPLVSIDYRGDSHSSTLDSLMTMVLGDKMVRVVSWYDNEWGYSCRVADLTRYVAKNSGLIEGGKKMEKEKVRVY